MTVQHLPEEETCRIGTKKTLSSSSVSDAEIAVELMRLGCPGTAAWVPQAVDRNKILTHVLKVGTNWATIEFLEMFEKWAEQETRS